MRAGSSERDDDIHKNFIEFTKSTEGKKEKVENAKEYRTMKMWKKVVPTTRDYFELFTII